MVRRRRQIRMRCQVRRRHVKPKLRHGEVVMIVIANIINRVGIRIIYKMIIIVGNMMIRSGSIVVVTSVIGLSSGGSSGSRSLTRDSGNGQNVINSNMRVDSLSVTFHIVLSSKSVATTLNRALDAAVSVVVGASNSINN